MPQLDVINIVTFVLFLCVIIDLTLFFFLSKVKTLIIFMYNVLRTHLNEDKNLINFFFFNQSLFIKKQQLKRIFTIF